MDNNFIGLGCNNNIINHMIQRINMSSEKVIPENTAIMNKMFLHPNIKIILII